MAGVRLKGAWSLFLSTFETKPRAAVIDLGKGTLEVLSATRTDVRATLRVARSSVSVVGRLKPGAPAIVTLTEANQAGEAVQNALEALLYIPPWWPNGNYDYDIIHGTMLIGAKSSIKSKQLTKTVIALTGIQPF